MADDNDSSKDDEGTSTKRTLENSHLVRQESTARKADDEKVEQACQVMMEKINGYLNGELTATCEDYKLLETLNKMTMSKYVEMSNLTKNLIQNMDEVNSKYESLRPYLIQIDMLEESVQKLEQAAYRIDAYSKELEARYKKIERK